MTHDKFKTCEELAVTAKEDSTQQKGVVNSSPKRIAWKVHPKAYINICVTKEILVNKS